jgi:hypothetical protein
MAAWLGWLAGRLTGWLLGWAGWLAYWLAAWLGWLTGLGRVAGATVNVNGTILTCDR